MSNTKQSDKGVFVTNEIITNHLCNKPERARVLISDVFLKKKQIPAGLEEVGQRTRVFGYVAAQSFLS